jgi:hypothetical protein
MKVGQKRARRHDAGPLDPDLDPDMRLATVLTHFWTGSAVEL